MEVYSGKEPYIFISYAHRDAKTVLPIIEKLQSQGFRIWYDKGIEAGTEWPQYIAEHLANASCVIVFMSSHSAESHNCRNEINLASELKKEMLVIHLEDFELALGLRLQLNLSQAMYRTRFENDEDFYEELLKAKIIHPYKCESVCDDEKTFEKVMTVKTVGKKKKALIICGVAIVVLIVGMIVLLSNTKGTTNRIESDTPVKQNGEQILEQDSGQLPEVEREQTPEPMQEQSHGMDLDRTSGEPQSSIPEQPQVQTPEQTEEQPDLSDEKLITDYETFYVTVKTATEKLGYRSVWDPSKLIDNMLIDQGDDGVWQTYYTNAITANGVNLHLGFCDGGTEIIAVMNNFTSENIDDAYRLMECVSDGVFGSYLTDFLDVMTNNDRVAWRNLGIDIRSIWNECLGLDEPEVSKYDNDTKPVTEYKTMLIDNLVIYVEKRSRTYNGTEYFDFTVLYENYN